MKQELIVMLTHNDRTVENAIEVFDELKELPITFWGFKDLGLHKEGMKFLAQTMRAEGKKICFEVVSLSKEKGQAGAELAADLGVNILMGTVFSDSVYDCVKGLPLAYYPFAGNVHGHPSILDGTIDEVVSHARHLESLGVDGLDLLSYRFTGDAQKMIGKVIKATTVPIISAGGINSFDKITEIRYAGASGFTIGTALIEKKFVPDGSLFDNLVAVVSWLDGEGTVANSPDNEKHTLKKAIPLTSNRQSIL